MVGFPGQQRPFHFNDIANANSPGRALGGCVVVIWELCGGDGHTAVHSWIRGLSGQVKGGVFWQ